MIDFFDIRKLLPWSVATAAVFLVPGTVHNADGSILGEFEGAASAEEAPAGWEFLWNAHGSIGDSRVYSLLSHDAQARSYGVRDENGAWKKDAPGSARYGSIFSYRDRDGVARFYIASYTLLEDAKGDIWITNGNLRNRSFPDGVSLQIYVNDDIRWQSVCPKDRFAFVFQENLGRLKKGDAVRVAVGPGENARQGGGKLVFTIEEMAEGEKPAAPAAILTPPLTVFQPQLENDGRPSKDFLKKHKIQNAALRTKQPELVFIGDSITERWPAELLAQAFGPYRPVNLGVGGDWVQNVHWRVLNSPLGEVRPRLIELMIGTNNISHGFTPDEIVQGVASLVKLLQEKTPEGKVLIQGILPRGGSNKGGDNDPIRETNAALARLADGNKVFYIDVGDSLVEPDGTILKEIMPDRLHVAGPGYDRWLKVLAPEVKRLLQSR